MKAMMLNRICSLDQTGEPLLLETIDDPEPGASELLIKVSACGVCHTELDEIEGRTPPPRLPVVPGHQVVGTVVECGDSVRSFQKENRVGVGWIFSACGRCRYCRADRENLCDSFMATGRDANGGYAEYMTVPASFAYAIPELFSDEEAAPLLCAGAIGYRSLRLTGLEDGWNLGLTGFGASGHLVLKLVQHNYPRTKVFVFARSERERRFALDLGATWSGDTRDRSPELLAAIIDTTPAWLPVVEAMKNLDKGGRLVINAIRKEERDKDELLKLDYPLHLWEEKEIKSVANVERRDVAEFLELASEIPIKPDVRTYPLEDANRALRELKEQKIRGAKVLSIG